MNAEATLRLAVAVEARCPARINSVFSSIWRRASANCPSRRSRLLQAPRHQPHAHRPRSMIITAPMVGCTSC